VYLRQDSTEPSHRFSANWPQKQAGRAYVPSGGCACHENSACHDRGDYTSAPVGSWRECDCPNREAEPAARADGGVWYLAPSTPGRRSFVEDVLAARNDGKRT
jgi:hypothetical protein